MNEKDGVINPIPQIVDETIPIIHAPFAVNLGNLELSYSKLQPIIGKPETVDEFNFLLLQPKKYAGADHIIYKVSTDIYHTDSVSMEQGVLNPCPPGHPYELKCFLTFGLFWVFPKQQYDTHKIKYTVYQKGVLY